MDHGWSTDNNRKVTGRDYVGKLGTVKKKLNKSSHVRDLKRLEFIPSDRCAAAAASHFNHK